MNHTMTNGPNADVHQEYCSISSIHIARNNAVGGYDTAG